MAWTAQIQLSFDGKHHHLFCRTDGDSEAAALLGAQTVFDAFSAGREIFVREEPGAASEVDFETKMRIHRGYVRFSFSERDRAAA